MDFSLSPKSEDLRKRVAAFMDQHVYAAEKEVLAHERADSHEEHPIMKEIRKKAKAEGLLARAPSTAWRPTPATWKFSPNSAPTSRNSDGSSPASTARFAHVSR